MEIISLSILDSQHLDWVCGGCLATPLSQYLQITPDFYHHFLSPSVPILAQTIEDPDILGQMQDAWNNFITTGQVWALLIGMFFGYLFKSLTSY